MAQQVSITIPPYLTAAQAAETLTAYRLQRGAFGNEEGLHGPFLAGRADEKHRFQLEGSNNYWLIVDLDDTALLSCRYSGRQEAVIQAMADLFHAQNPLRGS